MVACLPWAFPALGYRAKDSIPVYGFESAGFSALLVSVLICFAVGGLLMWVGKGSEGKLFRKEAMAIVGLSWVMATVLGALPFYFCQVKYTTTVRLFGETSKTAEVFDFQAWNQHWKTKELTDDQRQVLMALADDDVGALGLSPTQLATQFEKRGVEPIGVLDKLAASDPDWQAVIVFPNSDKRAPADRTGNFRFRQVPMGITDCLFESQSGFSTTGATVIADLEDPKLVPHCILFWRSVTHFLGGLGIIVLFVVILGQGSAGKALMRAEMPGPTKEGTTARMQHTAWLFAAMYCALNAVLAIILWVHPDMTLFDALCHAFGTMATGGFSTRNSSVGGFDSAYIDYVITAFMILAGTNFTLLYLVLVLRQPWKLLQDTEWRTYMGLILSVTVFVVVLGTMGKPGFSNITDAIRYGIFQVVAIITTTGYGTNDFDRWDDFGRASLLILMFVGGCAGSTGGGMKVIRHLMFVKILRLEMEQSFHPRVVRPLRVGGEPVVDPELRKNILVYFALILIIFVLSWLFVVTTEPDTTWGPSEEHQSHKLLDSASAVAASLNNIGPGLGIVGASKNYAFFSPLNKILFVWLMMIGRLEIFAILVLFIPGFWRDR